MSNPTLDALYAQHIPSAIREAESDDFCDDVFLNLGHRVIDEFWMVNKSNFARHSAHRLNLESTGSVQFLNQPACQTLRQLLEILMSAEIEFRIESKMTLEQRKKLGSLFRQIGIGFILNNWTGHARYCFTSAAQLFGDLRLYKLEDECWYQEAKAAMNQTTGWTKAKTWALFLFTGFGYRPYRLLYSCFLTVALFACTYFIIQPTWTFFQCLSVSSMNYMAALGYGDVKDAPQFTQAIVIIQGFLSLVLNTTLFALLVRRWFRS